MIQYARQSRSSQSKSARELSTLRRIVRVNVFYFHARDYTPLVAKKIPKAICMNMITCITIETCDLEKLHILRLINDDFEKIIWPELIERRDFVLR